MDLKSIEFGTWAAWIGVAISLALGLKNQWNAREKFNIGKCYSCYFDRPHLDSNETLQSLYLIIIIENLSSRAVSITSISILGSEYEASNYIPDYFNPIKIPAGNKTYNICCANITAVPITLSAYQSICVTIPFVDVPEFSHDTDVTFVFKTPRKTIQKIVNVKDIRHLPTIPAKIIKFHQNGCDFTAF